ncbi:nucleotide-binding universal stress UspA family protein [Streptomyces sp. SAI-170]|uniref:universal stress protein n=1 Tax=Streptomyces sp. SAI-170 TaxID=3377729 RepID=UPI003C7BDBE9
MSTLPVIAAVDGSDDSLRALDWALDTARRREAPLTVVHVRHETAWTQPGAPVVLPPPAEDDPVLADARTRLAGHADGVDTQYAALDGAPGVLLPELGAEAQLLVLGSRGRGGFASLLMGSNGIAAARDAECPVVVVPRPGREVTDALPQEPGPRIVVGLKVEGPDEAALDLAFTEAALRGARVQAVAAYPWPVQDWSMSAELASVMIDRAPIESETRTLAEGFLAPHRQRHPDVPAEALPVPGDAAGALVSASPGAELTVVGRHRRRLLAPARMLGSVTHAVLLHAASPVAVVPPVADPTPASNA